MQRVVLHALVLMVFGTVAGGCERGAPPAASDSSAAAAVEDENPVLAAGALPSGVTAAEVEQGRDLFLPCAVCHGFDGRGNQLGPSLRDGEWIHIGGSLQEIEGVIRHGVPQPAQYPVPMVPMGGGDFEDGEVRAVAAYVFAISRPAGTAPDSARAVPASATSP